MFFHKAGHYSCGVAPSPVVLRWRDGVCGERPDTVAVCQWRTGLLPTPRSRGCSAVTVVCVQGPTGPLQVVHLQLTKDAQLRTVEQVCFRLCARARCRMCVSASVCARLV